MFYDRAIVEGPARITKGGHLVATARVGRANNIQTYTAAEVGLSDRQPNDPIRLFRAADDVFAKDALASLANRPVTINHPSGDVNASNWRSLAVGDVGSDILRDGEFMNVPLVVMDERGVEAVSTTHREFSLGYTAVIDMTPGVHDGQPYDGRMTKFSYNHLAAVPSARGGAELRIVDERTVLPKETYVKTITYGGLPVKLDDAAAVEAVITQAIAAKDAAEGATTATKALLDAETGKVAALEKQLADAKAALDPAALDKRVADRSALIATAKAIKTGIVTDGKSDADIRKEVVAARLGDAATALNDDAIIGAFALLAKDAKPADTVVNLGAPVVLGDAAAEYAKARDARKNSMANAWKQPASAAA